MSARQEAEPKRKYTSPGKDRITPEFRARKNWDKVPDYTKLPDFALVDASEVSLITGMSLSTLNKRVEDRTFPAPSRHGRNRIWQLGTVRHYCKKFGPTLDEEGVK
jgi:predicted DNA-binding transcriptional regulator AlpA